MCKCNGKGYVVQTAMQGAVAFAPCGCEHTERARQEFEQEMNDFRHRLREAKERLKMEVSG
ncbi:MAG: hypothetical protein K6T39_01700 [Anoxybacillus ayderensis]|nr:hypothetical protein [Anoxybacillus ayderensis]